MSSLPLDLSEISAADMAVLDQHIESNWPDAWGDFARVFFAGLIASKDFTGTRETMASVAADQVKVLAHQLGGQAVYIPRGHLVQRSNAAADIQRDFKGNNHLELAQRYGVTPMRIRQIVEAKARKRK